MNREGHSYRETSVAGEGGESPNYRGFTPEEFQMLDFARIDLSEWFGDIEVNTQDQIESNMEEFVEGFYDKLSSYPGSCRNYSIPFAMLSMERNVPSP